REVLQQVRETTLEGYAHQELPFEKLVEAVQPQRDLRRSPLFQVMFVFQNTAPQSLDLPDVQSEFLKFSLDLAKFDLSLSVTETKTGLDLTVEYSTELFEVATVQRLLDSYQVLLEGILSQKTANWRQLPLLSIQEQRKLLVEWAQSEQSASYEVSDLPLHRLFEEQIARTPHATALVYQDQRLSFSELNQQANQLASYLSKYISHTEIPVGLCIERSPAMLIGLLAILKAGGYYVPLDPAYPQERLAFLMKDAHIALLITQQHLLAALPVLAEIQRLVICVDTDQAKIALEPTENLAREVSADNLAYSIYTSGSTGRPKGVLVPHRGVSNVIHHTLSMAVQQAGQQMLQQTSLSFDASVLEIFTSLLSGGCLHLLPPELAGSGEGLAHFIDERRIALLVITPSMLEVIPYAEYPALQTIILGGESCPVELANRWLQRYRVFNAYAPTETTIYMTQKELREPVQHALSLGRPIGHMSIYVLDPYMQPVPIGTRGELYIGGVGVTRGYHDLPALTAERFVPDPFSREPGRRLYRTGDLACYLPDGNLRFLGRDDDQIKIRGLRVELGEIEATLAQHPRVQQAIVLLEGQNAREKRLAACYVPVEGTDPAHELRPFLAQSLPSALIPGRFIAFTAFPLNPNGKIDRQTIQRMLAEQRDLFEKESIHQTPRNSVEERLAEIWQEALGIGSIGIHDNFFELGGHSLLATQIISRAREAFQTELPLRILFEAPTIAELAERIIQQEISQTEEETLALLLQQLQD
ncbi:MAG TPA: amino acid adenylation domain-containing protein, partial [Ktedonobacteraceae bacterium]|nr:amino acid adenylation domain-containing protein [Ktedonobacteraceae bacterium]